MTDYYDGPRGGIALFHGKPHLYESKFLDFERNAEGEYLEEDHYYLTLIDDTVLQLALEDWEIWLRWEAAFHAGLTDTSTHPALPPDRSRHEILKPLLSSALLTKKDDAIVAKAEFRAIPNSRPEGCFLKLEVAWTTISRIT